MAGDRSAQHLRHRWRRRDLLLRHRHAVPPLLVERVMELLHNLVLGFSVALTLQNLMYCFLGVFLGTMIGVLPGIGPLATMAMLLPLTFVLPPIPALIMLAGIYYGSDYG